MDELPKPIKRALRELAGTAYSVELGRALEALHGEFDRWKRGDITAFDLSEAIHQFHDGRARELYGRYVTGQTKAAVAYAVAHGVLDRSKVAPEVLQHLVGVLSFFEAQDGAQ
jgi:hypothetical protein